MMHDTRCLVLVERLPNMLVPWYLMASYMYYVRDNPILTDGCYDEICRLLRAQWHAVQHMHKYVIRRGDLRAGTCMIAASDYPQLTVNAALRLASEDAPYKPARVRLQKPAAPVGRVRLVKPQRVFMFKD